MKLQMSQISITGDIYIERFLNTFKNIEHKFIYGKDINNGNTIIVRINILLETIYNLSKSKKDLLYRLILEMKQDPKGRLNQFLVLLYYDAYTPPAWCPKCEVDAPYTGTPHQHQDYFPLSNLRKPFNVNNRQFACLAHGINKCDICWICCPFHNIIGCDKCCCDFVPSQKKKKNGLLTKTKDFYDQRPELLMEPAINAQ